MAHHLVDERRIAQVAGKLIEPATGQHFPSGHPVLQRTDRDQALDSEFDVVLPADEVVGYADMKSRGRQMQGRGPAQVTVATENQNAHAGLLLG